MNLSDELELSYYRPVADIQAAHGVRLVQHTESGKFFVEKRLTVYNRDLYEQLRQHPIANTPRICALGEDGPILRVIEEYIPGDTLQELLDEKGPLPEEEVIDIALQLAEIIRDLHHAVPPIIHRDIKPSNLILTPDGILKLLDFNAAKHPQSDEFRDTVLMGTSGFAAPEQYGFGSSNMQTDLYSYGLVLNVLLTGKFPTEKMAAGSLSAVIKKCTELNPKDRFPDIDAVIAVLPEANGRMGSRHSGDLRSEPNRKRRFLPPGFRSGRVSHMLVAALGYFLIFSVSLSINISDASASVLGLNRIMVLLMALCVVFFSCNYAGIWSHIPLCRSQKLWCRIPGILIGDFVIIFLFMLLLVILEPLF